MIVSHWLTSLKSRLAIPRASRRTLARRRVPRFGLESLEPRVMLDGHTVRFQFDFERYDPDLDQAAQDLIQEAADDLTDQLMDTFDAIPAGTQWAAEHEDPTTGEVDPIMNLVVPANRIRVFVGERDLPGTLLGHAHTGFRTFDAAANTTLARGEQGAMGAAVDRTDVAPWGGSIAFDTALDWGNRDQVYSLVQHELGHLLGIDRGYTDNNDTYQPTVWENNVMGGNFTGDAAVEVFGGPVPIIHDLRGAHFQNNVRIDGRQVSMARDLDGSQMGFSRLDYAALADIGWEVREEAIMRMDPEVEGDPEQQIVTGISGVTKMDPPAGFTVRDTTVAVFNGRTYRGFTDQDENVFIEYPGADGALMNFPTGQLARGNPSLTENAGRLFIAWTGTGERHLNVAEVFVNGDGIVTGIQSPHEVLGYTSDHALALGSHLGALVLAHSGRTDNELWLDVKAFAGPKTTWSMVLDSGERTERVPVLTPFDNNGVPELWVHWIGTDDAPNHARINFTTQVRQPLHSFPLTNGNLIIDGDQFGVGLDDQITIDRTAAGGVKVMLNDDMMEYAPGEIASITVRTGGGTNTINLLATFPAVPITIHGGGTDRLTFGPGLPTPMYSPDTTGRPGYGTLNVGGAMIRFNGLEYVNGFAPIVTGVQFTSVSVDENGVATVTGTFTDPGSYSTHSLSINWGDGTSDPLSRLVLGDRSFTATHRYLDDNPTGTPSDNFTITATITDNDNLTASGTTSVTVNNVRPQLQNVLATPVIDENGTVTISGEIVDPGTQDTFTLIVNWGEGAPQTFTYAAGVTHFSETHQYLDDNPTATLQDNYAISLTLADDDTGQSTAAVTTLVKNVAPVLTAFHAGASSDDKAREGELITATGSFTDIGTLDTHTAVIDWGDGTTSAAVVSDLGGAGTFTGTHTYQFGGIYNVKVILTDDDTAQVVSVDTVFITGAGLHDVDGKLVLQVVGTNEADQVTINQQGNGTARVHADFLDDPGRMRTFSLAGIDYIEVALCGGDDHAVVSSALSVPAIVDGGTGDDHLKGGRSGVVLIGGAGNDRLLSGSGRSILIGAGGSDHNLVGGSRDDILIGGSTLYDSGQDTDKLANDATLIRLLEEWLASDSFAARKARIEAGVDGLFLRKGDSIFDDGEKDVFVGGGGINWLSLFDLDEAQGNGQPV